MLWKRPPCGEALVFLISIKTIKPHSGAIRNNVSSGIMWFVPILCQFRVSNGTRQTFGGLGRHGEKGRNKGEGSAGGGGTPGKEKVLAAFPASLPSWESQPSHTHVYWSPKDSHHQLVPTWVSVQGRFLPSEPDRVTSLTFTMLRIPVLQDWIFLLTVRVLLNCTLVNISPTIVLLLSLGFNIPVS